MPLRHKRPPEIDPDQGAFIAATMAGNGAADLQNYGLIGRIEGVMPDGFYLDQATPTTDGAITPEAHLTTEALKAQHTAKRRRAQIGKHSPLKRDGTYMTLMPGDVLPPNENLGIVKPLIVKEGNFEYAKRYAAALERIRLERIRANPTLDAVRVSDVILFVADGFDLNKALDAARNIPRPVEEPKDELPRFNTLRARLKLVIGDADAARFVPASRSEINVVLPLIDHGIRSDGPVARGAAHNHLVETASASKKSVRAKGYSAKVQDWYADRAVASRCYEMVDYFEDAKASIVVVNDFIEQISDLSTDEERRAFIGGSYHPAMGVVLRHIVAHQLRDGETFTEELFFKPMGTTENRTTKLTELAGPGLRIAGRVITADELKQARTMVEAQVKQKIGQFTEAGKTMRNKTLVTPFTNPNMPKDVELFIHQTFVAIGLEDLQKLLPVVAESQERRQSFWRAALEDISGKYKPFVEPTLSGVKSPAP